VFVVFVLQISFREDGQGQWASEGVQLGGRGSAMGVIGLWTGAEHELSDPLGTCAQFFFFKHNHHHRLINQSIPLVPRLFPPVALFFSKWMHLLTFCLSGPFWAWKVGPLNVDGDGGGPARGHGAEGGSSTRNASGASGDESER